MNRLGLLGPILRMHRRIDAWAATPPSEHVALRPVSREQ